MDVPFVDLQRINAPLQPAFIEALKDTLAEQSLVLGEPVEQFERAFASYIGTSHCIGVSTGADALEIILRSFGIGVGDEVVVPANSFIATATAVTMAGATPVFADVQPNALISLQNIQKVVTPRTRAIIVVHLYGQCVDLLPITKWAKQQGIKVFEDACQAHGAWYQGRRAGNLADAAAFSFYPTKNLGALGDGGAITTSCARTADQAKLWRNYGSIEKYKHELAGRNARLDTLQAAFLLHKLPLLDDAVASRRSIARQYVEQLQGMPFDMVEADKINEHSCHLFVLTLHNRRDRAPFMAHLRQAGIATLIHYPIPIHLQQAYGPSPSAALTVAERLCDSVVSIPIFAGMTATEADRVIASVKRYFENEIPVRPSAYQS